MAHEEKTGVVTTTAQGSAVSRGEASATVLPAETGSVETQKPAATTAVEVLPPAGAMQESPLLTVLEKADQHASTLALADVSRGIAWQLAGESRRKDEQIKELTADCNRLRDSYTEERIKTTRLETEKAHRSDPPLAVGGMIVVALASVFVSVDHKGVAAWIEGALITVGVAMTLLALWRPAWLR